MAWVRLILGLLAACGALAVAASVAIAWAFWPLPRLELDWRQASADLLEVGECDLAYSVISNLNYEGDEDSLAASAAFLADPPCKLSAPDTEAEYLGYAVESASYGYDTFYGNAPQGWLTRLVNSNYGSTEWDSLDELGVAYPWLFWLRLTAHNLRCDGATYEQSTLYSMLNQIAAHLDDAAYVSSAWEAREWECAARQLMLAQTAAEVVYGLSDADQIEAAFGFADNLYSIYFTGDDGDIANEALSQQVDLELRMGRGRYATACERRLPNARATQMANSAATWAELLVGRRHEGSGHRLVALYSDGEFIEASPEAALFWSRATAAFAETEAETEATEDHHDLDAAASERIAAALEAVEKGEFDLIQAYLPQDPGAGGFHCRLEDPNGAPIPAPTKPGAQIGDEIIGEDIGQDDALGATDGAGDAVATEVDAEVVAESEPGPNTEAESDSGAEVVAE